MTACSGTVLPLSFTEEIQTLEGVSVAKNANVKGLQNRVYTDPGKSPSSSQNSRCLLRVIMAADAERREIYRDQCSAR